MVVGLAFRIMSSIYSATVLSIVEEMCHIMLCYSLSSCTRVPLVSISEGQLFTSM